MVDGSEWVGVVHIVVHVMRWNSVVFVLVIVIEVVSVFVLLGVVVVVVVTVIVLVTVVVVVVVAVVVVVVVVVTVFVVVRVDAGIPLRVVCGGVLEGEGGRRFFVGVMGFVVFQRCF